jgi:serine phosphatase RsbU (regulator of sigma subunit)
VTLGADAPPLGIDDDLDLAEPVTIRLEPGDVVAVLSDGFFEARNAEHEQLGVDRIVQVFLDRHQESAAKILLALRATVEEFMGGTPATDDRTAVVVKRTA